MLLALRSLVNAAIVREEEASKKAKKFNRIFEVDDVKNSDANVSKMLANSEDLASRPCRSRTYDALV